MRKNMKVSGFGSEDWGTGGEEIGLGFKIG